MTRTTSVPMVKVRLFMIFSLYILSDPFFSLRLDWLTNSLIAFATCSGWFFHRLGLAFRQLAMEPDRLYASRGRYRRFYPPHPDSSLHVRHSQFSFGA